MHFDKTNPKNATRNSKKIPHRNEKNSPIVRETVQLATLLQR